VPSPPTLADVVAVLDEQYDPAWAASWDAVGLVCGDPSVPVRRVLFAVDPVDAVADEALATGADLVVAHHPLFLRGVHGVAATTPKGRLLHRLLTNGVALHVAHTNADAASPGVSDALAEALGVVEDVRPLVPATGDPLDKIVTFVPHADAERVVDALAEAGAGALGDYTRCAYLMDGRGTFLPGAGADPAIGEVGRVEVVAETRVEMVAPRARRSRVVRALLDAHPYEEPAFDVIELVTSDGARGTGRVGRLAADTTLADFAAVVADALPATAAGVRVAGDPGARVRTVAVCGGSGDSLFGDVARTGADVYVTADLRHHPASEERANERCALVDVAHWASEWPWLQVAADRLVAALADRGTTVEARVSTVVTDPWTTHLPGGPS
jgi:dinuclear metal center YbgI/SA1388 family protein